MLAELYVLIKEEAIRFNTDGNTQNKQAKCESDRILRIPYLITYNPQNS